MNLPRLARLYNLAQLLSRKSLEGPHASEVGQKFLRCFLTYSRDSAQLAGELSPGAAAAVKSNRKAVRFVPDLLK